MDVAYRTSLMSKGQRLKVGAVLVKDNRIIACGYNGLPTGFEPDTLEINGVTRPEVIHAEQNAILDCARRGVSCEGGVLYVTHLPCLHCSANIAQAGIKEVYYREDYRISSLETLATLNIKTIKI